MKHQHLPEERRQRACVSFRGRRSTVGCRPLRVCPLACTDCEEGNHGDEPPAIARIHIDLCVAALKVERHDARHVAHE